MQNKQKILVGLVILLAVALIAMLMLKNSVKQNTQAPKIDRTDAPKGTVVSGLPKDFLLDSSGQTESSYTIKYDTQNQYTASFKTDNSIKDQYSAYIAFFEKNKFEIVNKSEAAVVSSIYAKNATGEVNVVISRLEKDTQTTVTVSYLKK